MSESLAIVGGGGWGTALAITQASAGRSVRLWVYEPDLAAAMQQTRENPVYLPGVQIPDSVFISNSIPEVVQDCPMILVAVPSNFFRSVAKRVMTVAGSDRIFISATKGIEMDTLMRMSEVLQDVAGTGSKLRVAVLSGPTFAPEVARGHPAALVIASPDKSLRVRLQANLSTPCFRLYTNADRTGVEMGGSVKNIIAIAAGVGDGLALGSNAMAALVTRGLAEITRLTVACGGKRETMAGLAGLGDLVLTSYGDLSRNRRVGIELGRGRSIRDIVAGTRSIAEGVATTKSAVQLARRHGIEMPIAEKMYAVLYEGLPPQTALSDLLERKLREE